ncbi:Hypothetical protein SMAX5B_000709 [Scophthalmus maximus]|uniref:Uncharacterized protein n=1 Tax=Scophthalmus maximus TaxID=52904 RepID=A0A2U9B672_SCOMX|nr:Hypothetical protein SMAX5B_000709 [Scophthalmus maximus]
MKEQVVEEMENTRKIICEWRETLEIDWPVLENPGWNSAKQLRWIQSEALLNQSKGDRGQQSGDDGGDVKCGPGLKDAKMEVEWRKKTEARTLTGHRRAAPAEDGRRGREDICPALDQLQGNTDGYSMRGRDQGRDAEGTANQHKMASWCEEDAAFDFNSRLRLVPIKKSNYKKICRTEAATLKGNEVGGLPRWKYEPI